MTLFTRRGDQWVKNFSILCSNFKQIVLQFTRWLMIIASFTILVLTPNHKFSLINGQISESNISHFTIVP